MGNAETGGIAVTRPCIGTDREQFNVNNKIKKYAQAETKGQR